jgi:alcohol dehydrogenase class IV
LNDDEFTWRDGERTIHFGVGVIAEAPVGLAEDSFCFHHVPPGPIDEVTAKLIDDVGDGDLVALGGGRVIDTAKAIAAVRGGRVAALPTTLSGAEMTSIHRLPPGHEPLAGMVRPQVVLADPLVMTTLPERHLRASAMNALAHGADSLYTPLANPVAEMAALRGATAIAKSLDSEPGGRDRGALALGSVLCAYALDSARFGLHHVVCQTLVRVLRLPHAETNAAMLPLTMGMLLERTRPQMTALARALGCKRDALPERLVELGGGRRRLSKLGAERDLVDEAVKVILARPELRDTPDVPGETDIRKLIESAW